MIKKKYILIAIFCAVILLIVFLLSSLNLTSGDIEITPLTEL